MDFPSPQHVLEASDELLRSAGLSGAKALYIKNVARVMLDKTIDCELFAQSSDEEIVNMLVKVKGIG